MLSEEEIIKYIKEMIQWSDHTTYKMALQGLLDIYQKEKEKNRLLMEGKFREVADKNSYIKDNFVSKDKIREIIGELEKQEDWYAENKSLDDLYGKIDILQELLEERN